MSWIDPSLIAPERWQAPMPVAGHIGPMVEGILRNRLGEQQLQMQQAQQLAQTIAQQRAGNAALQQAQAMGIGDPGALTGTGGQGFSDFAALLTAQRQQEAQKVLADEQVARAGLYGAQKDQASAMADAIRAYGGKPSMRVGGAGGSGNLVALPDGQGGTVKDANGDDVMVSPNSVVFRNAIANAPATPAQANAIVKPYNLTPNDVLDHKRQQGLAPNEDGSALVPLTPDQTYDEDATHIQIQPSTPGAQPVTITRDELERMKRAIIGPSYVPNIAPQMPRGSVTLPQGGLPGGAVTTNQPDRIPPNASTGAPVNTPRDAAIAELQKAGMPVTDANIKAAIGQLNFGQ